MASQSVEVDFRLQTDLLQMDEVVATGSGGLETSKTRLVKAISLVGSDDLQKLPIRTVTQALDSRITDGPIINGRGRVLRERQDTHARIGGREGGE